MRLTSILRFRKSIYNLKTDNLYVPKHNLVQDCDINYLEDFLLSRPNILVLTGAGISTESGIPDYRSENVGLYARSNHKPIQHMEFVKSVSVRQRYWTRNYVGWPKFSSTIPNATHYALAKFEREGRIQGIVTQNVDRLHSKAGTKNVIEVHGSGFIVMCLSCDYEIDRHEFQNILNTLNPEFHIQAPDMIRPDGDVEIPQQFVDNFKVPPCPQCGGSLKPKIVFFGDNVPKKTVDKINRMIYDSDGLLVLGSSLTVFSGYRIALETKDLNLPVSIVNIGETRGDHLAYIKISAKCGDIIPKLFKFNK